MLTRRICLPIKSFFSCWSFPRFSWSWWVTQGWYCREKLDAGHSWGQSLKADSYNCLTAIKILHLHLSFFVQRSSEVSHPFFLASYSKGEAKYDIWLLFKKENITSKYSLQTIPQYMLETRSASMVCLPHQGQVSLLLLNLFLFCLHFPAKNEKQIAFHFKHKLKYSSNDYSGKWTPSTTRN